MIYTKSSQQGNDSWPTGPDTVFDFNWIRGSDLRVHRGCIPLLSLAKYLPITVTSGEDPVSNPITWKISIKGLGNRFRNPLFWGWLILNFFSRTVRVMRDQQETGLSKINVRSNVQSIHHAEQWNPPAFYARRYCPSVLFSYSTAHPATEKQLNNMIFNVCIGLTFLNNGSHHCVTVQQCLWLTYPCLSIQFSIGKNLERSEVFQNKRGENQGMNHRCLIKRTAPQVA